MGSRAKFVILHFAILIHISYPTLIREYQLTPRQQQEIVDAHNQLRANEPASDMQEMVWDPNLAELALDWARRCDAWHRPASQRRGAGGYNYAGENIWWSNEKHLRQNLHSVITAFYSEKPWFDHNSASCQTGKVCGHYLTLAWAETCAVGCAASYCSDIQNSRGIPRGHIIICNYGPGGNRRFVSPYKVGPRCGSCPYTCTAKGLCPSKCATNEIQEDPLTSWRKNFQPGKQFTSSNFWWENPAKPMDKPHSEPVQMRVFATDASGRLELLPTLPIPQSPAPPPVVHRVAKLEQHRTIQSQRNNEEEGLTVCQNWHTLCPFWAKMHECQKNQKWMHENCYHSCNQNTCGSDENAIVVHTIGCADRDRKCNFWAMTGECKKNRMFMNWKCEASCGRCGDSGP